MPFNSILHYSSDIMPISAPLNGDQLCGHVYIAWPNYNNHCCRQQIEVSWDQWYLLDPKSFQRNIVSTQGSCINFETILVTYFQFSRGILTLCFPWPYYGYCYSLRESKCLDGLNRSFWSIMLVWKITIDVDYPQNCFKLKYGWFCQYV